jgi:hypothetical protein
MPGAAVFDFEKEDRQSAAAREQRSSPNIDFEIIMLNCVGSKAQLDSPRVAHAVLFAKGQDRDWRR